MGGISKYRSRTVLFDLQERKVVEGYCNHVKKGNPRYRTFASVLEFRTYLALLAFYRMDLIRCQQDIVLIPREGKMSSVTYVPDFVILDDEGAIHRIYEAKGIETSVFKLKARLLYSVFPKYYEKLVLVTQKPSRSPMESVTLYDLPRYLEKHG